MFAQVKPYIKLMRPHHYSKNFFIFLPLFFSGSLLQWALVRQTFTGFLAYCLISSVVYIYNDIQDAEKDRQHSEKCRRPIASGAVPVNKAAILAAVLLLLGLACQALAGPANFFSWLFLLSYLLMNLAYSWRLKHVVLLDISILAAGFLLRLVYGAALTGIAVSGWLYLTVLTMSFYMGLGKRRGELIRQKETRQVLKKYSQGFLEKSMNMCLTLTVAFYSLWAGGGHSLAWGEGERGGGMLWTVPLAILICLKYSLNIETDSDGDPVEVVLRDKVLCGLLLLFALLVFVLLYFV